MIIVNATFSIADAILALSTLSFLGLGLPPPHADWGTMLTNGLADLLNGARARYFLAGSGASLACVAGGPGRSRM